MRSEPTRLDGISLDFAGIPPRGDKNLTRASGPDRQGQITTGQATIECGFTLSDSQWDKVFFNPLMPGGNKKVTHT